MISLVPELPDDRTRRTTVDLPVALFEAADAAVRNGVARSRNALLAEALKRYLHDLEEEEIDAQFAAMQDDPAYAALMADMAEEFAVSDWGALQMGEGVAARVLDDEQG